MVNLNIVISKIGGGTRTLRVPDPAADIDENTVVVGVAKIVSGGNIFAGETLSALVRADVITTKRIKYLPA